MDERDKKIRAATDAEVAERHRGFDLSAQDNHMKYERASFIVVTASEAYRQGWERMFGNEATDKDVSREKE